jgi:TRAP-type C4-dicarboxylate transport system permease small subunit
MNVGGVRRVVDRVLEWLLVAFMSLLVVNVLWQVATRFLLRNPNSFTEETARYLLVWVGILGGAYAVGKRIHLAIDLLPSKLEGRRKAMLELFIEACIFVFAALVLVFGGSGLVWLTLDLGQTSAALQIPLGFVYLVLPLSGLLMMFYAALHGAEALSRLRAPGDAIDDGGAA